MTEISDTGTLLDGYLTDQELADELHVTIRTIVNMRARGDAPPRIKFAGRNLTHRNDARTWLRAQRREVA